MTISEAPPPPAGAEGMLERLRACSLRALECLEAGELDRVDALVTEREVLLQALASELVTTSPGPDLDASIAGALAVDARLQAGLRAGLEALGTEIRRLDARDRVSAGSSSGSSAHRVDVRG